MPGRSAARPTGLGPTGNLPPVIGRLRSIVLLIGCTAVVTAAVKVTASPHETPTKRATTPASAPVPQPPPAGADGASVPSTLLWSDEFDGTTLDTSVWKPYFSTYGDGNNELQCHTPANVAVSGGTVKLTAKREVVTCPNGSTREFSGAFLGTRDTGTYFPRYGRFEIRARLPHGQGLWPAFWLRHRNGSSTAEVDIMEYFHAQAPGATSVNLHFLGRKNVSKKTVPSDDPLNPAWHTWAVEIAPADEGVRFTFFLDGNPFHTYTDSPAEWNTGERLWDIAVNLSVGGDSVGHPDDARGYLRGPDRCGGEGVAPAFCRSDGILRAKFPATYEIDYVRVWGLPAAG